MRIEKDKFQKKLLEEFLSGNQVIPWVLWKVQKLAEEGETYYLPEYDSYYAVYKKFLFVHFSPDRKCHIPIDELNELDGMQLAPDVFDSVKDKLIGFDPPVYSWRLRYDREYKPPKLTDDFCVMEFDFTNEAHYELLCFDGSGDTIEIQKKIKRMYTSASVFDPSLWFFMVHKRTKKIIGSAISSYNESVKETDLDYIHIIPEYQGKGAGRFMMAEIIKRSLHHSDVIGVGGTVEFYRKCGFYDFTHRAWVKKPGYSLIAPSIQAEAD